MKFELKLGGRKYVLMLTPAALTLLSRLAYLSTKIPTSKEERRSWEVELNEGWTYLLRECISPTPKPEDELPLMMVLMKKGVEIMNASIQAKIEEVENT